MADASLTPIYERLHGTSGYHPFNAQTFADWSIEAGDTVTIKRGSDSYNSPIHVSRMVWKGTPQVSIEATGHRNRDPIARMSLRKYGRSGSGLRNSREMYLFAHDMYDEDGVLHASIYATVESFHMAYENLESSLRGEIVVTAQSLTTAFEDSANSIRSEIVQTASTLSSTITDTANSLRSQITQTASSLTSRFEDQANSLHSEIVQTASTLSSTITDTASSLRSSIQQNASRIGLVVDGNGIKAAQIVAAVNSSGSEVLLSADHVRISGDTTLSGVLTITDGALVVKKSSTFQGSITVTGTNSYIQSPQFTVPSSGQLRFIGSGTGEYYNVTTAILKTMVKSFSVENNTLTLTPFYGDPVTFSKATSLTGAWGSGTDAGKYIVTASPQGVQLKFDPPMRLNGGGGTNDFSAEITETVGSTTTARKSIYGYLVLTGSGATSAVKVNTKNDGTGTNVATLSVSSVYTEGDTAGKATGWSNAYGKVEIPTSNTSTNAATFKAPNATATSNPAQNAYSLSMNNQGDNAVNLAMSVNGATAITIARFTHNKYTAGETAGWSAAYGKVVVPTSNTSTNAATFKAPASTSSSNPAQNTYSLSMGNQGDNAMNLQMSVNGATAITIARFTHNKYSSGETAGWTAAYGKVAVPTSNTSSNSATFKTPNSASTSNPAQNSHALSMSNQGDNAVNLQMSTNSGTAITIARFTHNKYSSGETAGWTAAYGKVSVPGSNTSSSTATFKTPASSSTSNPVQNTHSLSIGNQGDNAVNLYMATNSGTAITIARFTHNKFTAGQKDTRDSVSTVPVTLSGGIVYDGGTGKYMQSGTATVTFSNGQTDVTGVDCWGGVDVTAAHTAGQSAGWSNAYGKVSIPGSNTSSNSATFKTPNSASNSNPVQNSHALSMGNQGNNAVDLYMATNSGTAITIARFTHNKYSSGETAGWSAAYGKVSVPGSNTSSNSATFKTPASSSGSNPVQNSHALSMGNQGDNAVDLYMATNSGTAITVARFTHNKYTAGQENCRSSISQVPVVLSGNVIRDSSTGKYMQHGEATVKFSNGQTQVTGIDCYGGVDVTAAFSAGVASVSGDYSTGFTDGQNNSRNSITNVVVSLTGQVAYNSQDGKYYQSGTATVNFSNGQSAKTGLDCYGGVDVSDARANGYAVSSGQISISGLQNASGSSSISGRTSAGGISRPSSQSYIFFSVSVHGTTKNYYISVN